MALGLVLIASPSLVSSAGCASGSSTLTTEGCSGCGGYDLCLGYTSKSACSGSGCETDGDCTYDCMSVDGNLTTLDVLIDFGGFRSAQETAAGGSPSQATRTSRIRGHRLVTTMSLRLGRSHCLIQSRPCTFILLSMFR